MSKIPSFDEFICSLFVFKKRTYCCNCKYIELDTDCNNPNNIERTRNFLRPYNQYKYKPNYLNRNNDCPYYKRTWYKFWVK